MTHPTSSWQPNTQPWIRNQPKHRLHTCPFCGSHTAALAIDDISDDNGRITLRCINVDCCAGAITVIAMGSPAASARHDVQALQAIDEIASSPNTTRDAQQSISQCRQSGTDIPEALTHPTATITRETAAKTLNDALDLIASMRSQEIALRAELRVAADTASSMVELARAISDDDSIEQSIATADLAITMTNHANEIDETISEFLVGDHGQLSLPRRVTPSQLADVTDGLLSLMGAMESITADDAAHNAVLSIEHLHHRLGQALKYVSADEFTSDPDYDQTAHDADKPAWFLRDQLADFSEESERLQHRLRQAITLHPQPVTEEMSYQRETILSKIDRTTRLLDNLRAAITTSVHEHCANSGSVDAMPNSAGAVLAIERITHYTKKTRLLFTTLGTS